MNYFANNIKFLLSALNISRDKFANVIGKKRSVIGSYIRSEAQPSLNILLKIANYFGIGLNILITSDLEKELKNKELTNIKELHNLIFIHDKSINEAAKLESSISGKITQINNKYKDLKYDINKINSEQKRILYENLEIKEKIDELSKIKKNKNSALLFYKYLNLKGIGLYFILLIILFFVYLGVTYIVNLRVLSEDDLFNKYYRPYKEDIYKNYNYELSKIKEYYAVGNYYGVLNEFKGSQTKDSFNIDRYFYQGLVYLELWQFQSAIENFTKILLLKNNKYSDESRWYLALCYLKLGQKMKAKGYFEEILKSQRYKNNEARQILKRLKL